MRVRHTGRVLSAAGAVGLATALFGSGGAGASVMGELPPFSDPVTFPGNACAGDLGTPPDCVLDGSPLIAKFDFDDDGNVTTFTPGVFDTIDGTEFSFDFDGGSAGADGNTGTGTWTYVPDGVEDPVITGFVAKGGPNYNAYTRAQPVIVFAALEDSAEFTTPLNQAGNIPGLSNISFYDTAVVPIPAALPLLGTAVAGLAWMRRRRGATPAT
jgi:hypothetical protein